MASYDFIYNGVNLSNLVRVRAVETTVLPPRENHAITIWERPGSIYNSYRYGERDIVVTFLIRATQQEYNSNPRCMENKLNTLRNVFKVTEPKPLYLGDTSKYIYAVPEGDFKMTELRYDCYECEIQFVCHNPEYYSASVKASTNSISSSTYGMRNSSNNNKTIDIYNGGNASAYPIINIGINDNVSFIQIENTTNGNKFLLGNYVDIGKNLTSNLRTVLHDDMTDVYDWGTAITCGGLDYGRADDGTFINIKDGSAIKLDKVGNENIAATWHGAAAQRTLKDALTNFEVKAKMLFNSHGIEGDPIDPQLYEESIENGNRDYYYKVMAPSVPIRVDPDISSTVVGTYNKGDEVHDVPSVSNGWLQVEDGYCEAIYFKKYISDTTITDVAMNVIANKEIELWSRPSDDSSESLLLATIDVRTPLRVHRGTERGYYKLYIPYNGKVGYVNSSKVTTYTGYEDSYPTVNYPEEEIIVSDDNKTGICEVYGFDDNGNKLFKLSLCDDNKYSEFIKPSIGIGYTTMLEDKSVISKSNNYNNDMNVAYDPLSEGTYDWNNFYGELGIRRENGKWQAWVYKMEHGSVVKRLTLKEQEFVNMTSYQPPDGDLHHIVIYMGTADSNNKCGMAITDIRVDEIRTIDKNAAIVGVPFKAGDEVKIDCYNNKVYLNNNPYNDIDMDSQFIELVAGNNVLKVASNPNDEFYFPFVTILFNERYL